MGGLMSSLKSDARDWEGLGRKLRAGKSLDQAAAETGIPLDEVAKFFEDRAKATEHEVECFGMAADDAMKRGLRELRKIAKAGPRYSETEYSDEGKPMSSRTPISTDLEAAKLLLKFAENVKLKLRRNQAQAQVAKSQADLFDKAQPEQLYGPWVIKQTTV